MRSGAIDTVRVMGVIAIVAAHYWNNEYTRAWLYSWHVPVFFFLTGYLWKNGRSIRDEAGKRFHTLLVPYGVWLAILGAGLLLKLALEGKFRESIFFNLLWGGQYIGRPFSAFWFVTALFAVAILMRVLENFPKWVGPAIAIYALVATYDRGEIVAGVPLSVGIAFPALLFVYAGQFAKLYKPGLHIRGAVGLVLLSAGLVLATLGITSPLDMKQGDFGTPGWSVLVAAAISAGLVWSIEWLMTSIGAQVHRAATALAQVGFLVVLTHMVPHWLMGVENTGTIFVFLIGLVLPWVVALAIRRTPFARFLIGTTPIRRNASVKPDPIPS
ncbi:acyltransferase family protein [Arthrobacter sp. NPDC055138]